jgi:hypothetical protein
MHESTGAITPVELALLHHLEHAAESRDLPKHVAHDLTQQGLAEAAGQSPGRVVLTEAGIQRLRELSRRRQQAGDVLH